MQSKPCNQGNHSVVKTTNPFLPCGGTSQQTANKKMGKFTKTELACTKECFYVCIVTGNSYINVPWNKGNTKHTQKYSSTNVHLVSTIGGTSQYNKSLHK